MTDTRVKVLCGQCGGPLCQIIDGPGGTYFRMRWGTSADAGHVFCSEHGWADLLADKLVADLARARDTGRVVTYRARVSRAPIPDRASYAEIARARLMRSEGRTDPNQ